jgi:hypothetical protein
MEIAETLRLINRHVNPEVSVEITIDALGAGSFRARLKSAHKGLFRIAKKASGEIVIGLLVAIIYDKLLATHPDIKIVVNDDSYVVQTGADRIVLPRDVNEKKAQIERDPEIAGHISRLFDTLENDESIADFGIVKTLTDPRPIVRIPRADFPVLAIPSEIVTKEDTNSRTEITEAKLQLVRVIFERSRRKWQFVWNGVKISAPIEDDEFLERVMRHELKLGSGDVLSVTLQIHQVRDVSGVFVNASYVVTKVHGYTEGPLQGGLFDGR